MVFSSARAHRLIIVENNSNCLIKSSKFGSYVSNISAKLEFLILIIFGKPFWWKFEKIVRNEMEVGWKGSSKELESSKICE